MRPHAVLALVLLPAIASAQVVINEIRIDNPGTDEEFFELAGPAGTDLTGLTYLVIGDLPAAGAGGYTEAVVDLAGSSIPSSGYFVAAESTFALGTADLTTTLDFENSDNVTHLLVSGYTGTGVGQDLDVDDDGVLDSPLPWTATVDVVSLVETAGTGDLVYGIPKVGPNGSFVPAHTFRNPDGASDFYTWATGQFTTGIDDTPGAPNAPAVLDLSTGGAHEMIVNPGPVGVGMVYFVLGSMTGTSPGSPFGAVVIPLNYDPYTFFTIANANTPALFNTAGFVGTLPSLIGVDQCTLTVPPDGSLTGLTANHAVVLINPFTALVEQTSAALPLALQ